jgi:hypothetical protein
MKNMAIAAAARRAAKRTPGNHGRRSFDRKRFPLPPTSGFAMSSHANLSATVQSDPPLWNPDAPVPPPGELELTSDDGVPMETNEHRVQMVLLIQSLKFAAPNENSSSWWLDASGNVLPSPEECVEVERQRADAAEAQAAAEHDRGERERQRAEQLQAGLRKRSGDVAPSQSPSWAARPRSNVAPRRGY